MLGGHNSSKENLNEARNKILAFRVVMNYASTYTVKPINSAIESVSSAFAAVPTVGPILKIAVAAAGCGGNRDLRRLGAVDEGRGGLCPEKGAGGFIRHGSARRVCGGFEQSFGKY